MSYSNYQLNQRINNLQNQINNTTLEDVLTNGATATDKTITFNSVNVPTLQSNINYGGINFIDQSVVGQYQDVSIVANMIRMNDIDTSTNNKTRTTITDTEFDVRFRPSNTITTPEPYANMTKDIIVVNDGALNGDNKVISIEPTALNIIEYDNSIVLNQVEITPTSITASNMDMNGQFVFDVPPHCITNATTGIDLVNKGYVDSLVGQYSGGYNLFFNYSVVDGIYRSLGQSVITAPQQIVPITTDTTNQLVASFVSSALGITTIPAGIWNVLIYSEVNAIGGTLTYFYELYKLTGVTETLIFTSGTSSDVNATTTPTAYNISGTLTAPETLLLTDKIIIKIYLHKDGTPQLVNTYFQNNYYSFTQTTLNAGTTLLSSNNNWTGTNNFETLGIKSTSIDSSTTLAIGGTTATSVTLGRLGQNVNFEGNVKTNTIDIYNPGTLSLCPNSGNLSLGRVGMATLNATATNINLETAIGSTSSINILNGGGATTGGSVNIANGATQSTNVNIGSITSTGVVNILGGIGNSINIGTGAGARTLSIGSSTNVANICGIQINTAQISNVTKITCPELASSAVGTAVSFYTANQSGTCNFFTSNIRTGDLNIQTASTNPNIINIGSSTSTTNIRGLTMPTNQFITMASNNTALPAVNQIGYIYNVALPNGAGFVDNANLTTGVSQEYGTVASLPAGVYMVSVNVNMQQVALTTITSVVLTISATGNTPYIDRKPFSNGAIAVNNYSLSGIISRGSVLTAVACSLTVSFTGTAPKMSVDSFKFNIVRIA